VRGGSRPFLGFAGSVEACERWEENAFNLAWFWKVSPDTVFDLPLDEVDKWSRHATRIRDAEAEAEAARMRALVGNRG
jgi:hypothetical protein